MKMFKPPKFSVKSCLCSQPVCIIYLSLQTDCGDQHKDTMCSLLISPHRISGYQSLSAIDFALHFQIIMWSYWQTCIYLYGKVVLWLSLKSWVTIVLVSCCLLFFGSVISFLLSGSISQCTGPSSGSTINSLVFQRQCFSLYTLIKPCNCDTNSFRSEQTDRKKPDALFCVVGVWLYEWVFVCVCVCSLRWEGGFHTGVQSVSCVIFSDTDRCTSSELTGSCTFTCYRFTVQHCSVIFSVRIWFILVCLCVRSSLMWVEVDGGKRSERINKQRDNTMLQSMERNTRDEMGKRRFLFCFVFSLFWGVVVRVQKEHVFR